MRRTPRNPSRTLPSDRTPCEGPLIWFDTQGGAILECRCGYIVVSGSFNDVAHAETPILREGLVS